MSVVNSTVCSHAFASNACSSDACSSNACIVLPAVLINRILTYIAELNGATWVQLINPNNDSKYARVNQWAPFFNPIKRAFAHRSCNYPHPIMIGINGVYVEGTIICLSWESNYAEPIGAEEGEIAEYFETRELIWYDDAQGGEYIILNGIYDDANQFHLLESFVHYPVGHEYENGTSGIKITDATFQYRDLIDIQTLVFDVEDNDTDVEDNFDGFGDEDFDGAAFGWDEQNNGGIGW